eukprot:5630552-Prymnesium_polylepis.1
MGAAVVGMGVAHALLLAAHVEAILCARHPTAYAPQPARHSPSTARTPPPLPNPRAATRLQRARRHHSQPALRHHSTARGRQHVPPSRNDRAMRAPHQARPGPARARPRPPPSPSPPRDASPASPPSRHTTLVAHQIWACAWVASPTAPSGRLYPPSRASYSA